MAAEGGQYRLSVPGEEPLRERSNSYSDAVVALSAVSPETNPLQRRDSDVPHSLEAGAGRRPSAAVIISQAEAQVLLLGGPSQKLGLSFTTVELCSKEGKMGFHILCASVLPFHGTNALLRP